MAHIVPSSKIVFTDLMVLLVAVLMGLNSIMDFEDAEGKLPPINLPQAEQTAGAGQTSINPVTITVQEDGDGNRLFFYNQQQLDLPQLVDLLRQNRIRAVVLRVDRDMRFPWQDFCDLTRQFTQSGVKQVSYAADTSNRQTVRGESS